MAKKPVQTDLLQQLKNDIRSKEMGRLYIFHGEEIFLLHHYFEQVKKLLIDDLTESFNFHKLNNETFDIQSFVDAVENFPMMAEHTFVWVDDIDVFKFSEDEREKMAQILLDVPEYCTVLFTYETTPWHPDGRFRKLYQAMVDNAYVVEFAKQSENAGCEY